MRYAVPRGNREWASWPTLDDLPALLEKNLSLKASHAFKVLGMDLDEFRAACRRDVWRAACDYAEAISMPRPPSLEGPLVATGHQAELYHCGVWVKSHLASRLGAVTGATSFNLIVDNDVPKHLGLVMPVVVDGQWHQREVELCARQGEKPFEEYPPFLDDADRFRAAVGEFSRGAPFEEAARQLAERLCDAQGIGRSIADVTSAVRSVYEREAGLGNVELPVSRLSETESFGLFVASLLCDVRRFVGCYNTALARYRGDEGIRNAANPLPDLVIGEVIVEAPFWVWRAGGQRSRLYVECVGDWVGLMDSKGQVGSINCSDAEAVVESWHKLIEAGVKIRPRALATTIFMRMFLSDLFIHGIGGAKYDEVTDRIIRAFYGVEAPAYAIISATLTIPWDFAPVDPADVTRLTGELRDMRYNPQRHMPAERLPGEVDALIRDKWELVASEADTGHRRREKFLEIRRLNGLLAERIEDLARLTQSRLEETIKRVADDRVAFSREYSCFLVGAQAACEFYDELFAPLAG